MTSTPGLKKKPKEKRVASPEEVLVPLIFKAFQEKPFWTLSELNSKLKQPEEYLKGHLRKVCTYHASGANRSHFELKKEFKPAEADVEEDDNGEVQEPPTKRRKLKIEDEMEED